MWGSTTEKKKQHLISWQKICKPKEDGGLGIRSSEKMNKALIAKVGWRLLHDDTSLWARVVRHKYKVGDVHARDWLEVKSNWSVVWKSVIKGLREVVLRGQGWSLGDGRHICFWTDRWLSNTPLADQSTSVLPDNYESLTAKDLWSLET